MFTLREHYSIVNRGVNKIVHKPLMFTFREQLTIMNIQCYWGQLRFIFLGHVHFVDPLEKFFETAPFSSWGFPGIVAQHSAALFHRGLL